MHVHETDWLKYSSRSSVGRRFLRNFAKKHHLRQIVNQPTREGNLLDLVLTDAPVANSRVEAKITDQSCVMTSLPQQLPVYKRRVRTVWRHEHAMWDAIYFQLGEIRWCTIATSRPDSAAEWIRDQIMDCMSEHIPMETRTFGDSKHQSVNASQWHWSSHQRRCLVKW